MKDGEYPLKLDQDEVVLRASPHVLRTILTKHQGIRQVLQKIYMIEEEAIYDVIVAGLADTPGMSKDWKSTVRDNIFKHGILDLVEPIIGFVNFLGNGGRHEAPKEEDDSGKV